MTDLSDKQRIFIIGGSGAGKTTLALLLSQRLGLPAHHLDDIARPQGASGRMSSAAELESALTDILSEERWIVEGIDLGWTDPLLVRADLIVWLDTGGARHGSIRIIGRFLARALEEARRQPGRRKLLRLRDYRRQLSYLLRSLAQRRRYEGPSLGLIEPTKAATGERLKAHDAKLVRCTSRADLENLLGSP